jgi:hypothetical protein
MKLSDSLLKAMLVAITAGTIVSCEKAEAEEIKKSATENPKSGTSPEVNAPECCPACGMG